MVFYLFDAGNEGMIVNNSIVLTDNFGQIPHLQCISGSQSSNVGQWISPTGNDVTYVSTDSFDITLGDSSDPGYIEVSLVAGRSVTFSDQGVYECRIPDEDGILVSLFVGIYLPLLASKPDVLLFVHLPM